MLHSLTECSFRWVSPIKAYAALSESFKREISILKILASCSPAGSQNWVQISSGIQFFMMLSLQQDICLNALTPNVPLFLTEMQCSLILFWIIGLITETLSENFCWLNFNAISFLTYESRKTSIKKDENREMLLLSDLLVSLYLDIVFIDYF